MSGFNFGGQNASNAQGGFSFGNAAASTTANTGFSFNQSSVSANAQPSSTGFSFGQSAGAATSTTPSQGFSLGAPTGQSTTSGISFGQTAGSSFSLSQQPAAPQPSSGFSFSQPAATSSMNSGIPLSQPASGPATSSGFSFGQPNNSATTPNQGLSFSKPTAAPSGFAQSVPAASSTGGGFSFGGLSAHKPAAPATTTTVAPTPQFSLGGTGSGTAPSGGGFSLFGGKTSSASLSSATTGAGPTLIAPAASSTSTGGFSFGGLSSKPSTGITTTTATPLSLAMSTSSAPPIPPAGTGGFTMFGGKPPAPSTTTAAAAPSIASSQGFSGAFNLTPGTTPVSSTPTLSGLLAAKPSTTSLTGTITTASPAATTAFSIPAAKISAPNSTSSGISLPIATTAAAPIPTVGGKPAAVSGSVLTYHQLEEMMNKWTLEMDEQENLFLDEARKLNNWEKIIVENGDKIGSLYDRVEQCKGDQGRLEQELDFIETQQRELELVLEPLEKAVEELPPGHQHADREREAIFQLAQNCDNELSQILADLKDVVERLNESNPNLVSSCLESGGKPDSVAQVTKIMNAHMHSLDWIQQNTNELSEKIRKVEEAM